SFVLEPLGFMVTCFLFLISYGLLLGERKYLRLVLFALLITLVLYICFGVLLSVNLPRGTVPFLRNFALFIESLIP
ncbi:MAG: tripartite tricarboxylate transporter TctB family protein, partial [Clostridia bacterium]